MIEVMTDLLKQPADGAVGWVTRLAPPAPDPAAVARVRSLLDGARAPLVFAGGGSRLAADRVVALAEALDAPVVTSFNGKGVMPPGHPLHAGSSEEEPSIRRLIEDSDVCIALGTRFAEEYTCHWAVGFPAAMVQVDLDPLADRPQLPGGRGRGAPMSALFCDALLELSPPAGARDGAGEARAALSGRQAEVAAHGFEEERELIAPARGRRCRTTPSPSRT